MFHECPQLIPLQPEVKAEPQVTQEVVQEVIMAPVPEEPAPVQESQIEVEISSVEAKPIKEIQVGRDAHVCGLNICFSFYFSSKHSFSLECYYFHLIVPLHFFLQSFFNLGCYCLSSNLSIIFLLFLVL